MNLFELGEFLIARQKSFVAKTNALVPPQLVTPKIQDEYELSGRAKTRIAQIAQHPEAYKEPFHREPQAQVLYLYSGHCEVIVDQHRISLAGGNLLYIDADTPFQIQPLQAGAILLKLALEPTFIAQLVQTTVQSELGVTLQQILQQKTWEHFALFLSKKMEDPAYIMDRILCEYFNQREHYEAAMQAMFQLLFIELLRGEFYDANQTAATKRKYTVEDFLTYIETHYQSSNLQQMANFFNYNANYLSNTLKETTGCCYMELVQIKKMTVAAVLLTNPQISIEEIIEYIGYSSPSFFYKKFKAYFNQTPTEMRENL